MRFTDFLSEDCIVADLKARDRDEVLHELAGVLAATTRAPSEQLEKELVARERISSTAIGDGVAIPHCRFDRMRHITACVAVDREGVDFGARDGRPVHLFVTLVSPTHAPGTHLSVLARIAALLRDVRLRQALVEAPSTAAIRALLVQAEDAYLASQQSRHDIHVPAGGP
ncbi:PTS sugar transporter subunit IIA [Vitiosangium sp. GDMCC 1.1324]|uniref:PTS sugar transporter subunit IIA n=1 Tax=Vitiosangium sp. (strain GDMCC 1.1324) TaxID=2138576 RepID=UPI000D3D2A8A|nr:PTS sugar transporter subunit IIA [Vitiosangium sp. GDMCC 1.1324]PTL84927.1 PTS transporter subunit IIa [Vitiosangium sp. GDMCC 1.1324]